MNLSLEWMEGRMDGWMDGWMKNRTLVVERALTRHRCDLTLSVKTTGAAAVGLRHSVDRVLSRKTCFFWFNDKVYRTDARASNGMQCHLWSAFLTTMV